VVTLLIAVEYTVARVVHTPLVLLTNPPNQLQNVTDQLKNPGWPFIYSSFPKSISLSSFRLDHLFDSNTDGFVHFLGVLILFDSWPCASGTLPRFVDARRQHSSRFFHDSPACPASSVAYEVPCSIPIVAHRAATLAPSIRLSYLQTCLTHGSPR